MAEYLSAVASAVQLVDVALRASQDVRELREKANVRGLRHFASEFRKSANAIDEFEILSETLTDSFAGFYNDIVALKHILPPKPSQAVVEKIKWAYNKRRVRELSRRLKEREQSLALTLSITGRLHGLRIREDTIALLAKNKHTHSNIRTQMDAMDQRLNAQQHNNDQVLRLLKSSNDSVIAVRNNVAKNREELYQNDQHTMAEISKLKSASRHHHASTQLAVRRSGARISKRLRNISRKGEALQHTMIDSHDSLSRLHSNVDAGFNNTLESLEGIATALTDIQHTTFTPTAVMNMMTEGFRQEVCCLLEPILERAYARSEVREKLMQDKMALLMNAMTSDVGCDMYLLNSHSWRYGCDMAGTEQLDFPGYNANLDVQDLHGARGPISSGDAREQPRHIVESKHHNTWLFKCRIGSLSIKLCTTTRRSTGLSNLALSTNTDLSVHFWPKQSLLRIRGLEMLFRFGPDIRGFYHPAPSLRCIPIVTSAHPMLQAISSGDLISVQELLTSGEGALRMEDEVGSTLLHWAARYGTIEICTFLAAQGLSWKQSNSVNMTPMHLLLYGSLSLTSQHLDPDRTKSLALLKEIDDDFERLWWEHGVLYMPRQGAEHADTHRFLDAVRYLTHHSKDGWPLICNVLTFVAFSPGFTFLYLLQACIRHGLNPNLITSTECEDGSILSIHLLHHAIWEAMTARGQSLRQNTCQAQTEAYTSIEEVRARDGETSKPHLWCIITELIQQGADIYHVDAKSVESALHWSDLITPWDYALKVDFEEEWLHAVRESGHNIDEYRLEDVKRCKELIRLHGATRSGIDERVLDLPSISGLRCRPCGRKFCKKHRCDPFDDLD